MVPGKYSDDRADARTQHGKIDFRSELATVYVIEKYNLFWEIASPFVSVHSPFAYKNKKSFKKLNFVPKYNSFQP